MQFLSLTLLAVKSDLSKAAETPARGVAIAIAGMLIVISVLSFISIFIALLPKVLAVVAKVWPEVEHGNAHSGKTHPESLLPDDEAVLAAVGYVLHLKAQGKLPVNPP